ncbi:MAG: DMT family transporter [Paracoccaceae bacterium]|nr:DMT family transporter [Paracoccaceae bacterium]MDG1738172.1 DMT family transporter [Paracoccaceae bacterium]MDG2258982.1 DMT family transporter [Paracoccaceae bacterium]
MAETPNHNALVGILWMIFTGLCFVGVTALVKVLGTRLPAQQTAFIRYALGLVLVLPALKSVLAAKITRKQLGLLSVRGIVHTGGVILWFYAMARIPIADVTAMNYVSPVYVTIAAAIFLGEKLAARRIIAVMLGLVGAVIILRPGFRELNPGHIAMIFVPMSFGASYILAKRASNELSPTVIVAMLTVVVSIGLAPLAWPVWITPTPYEIAILAGVAVLATLAHYSMSLAFQAAPVSVTQPVTFLQLVWAVLLGSLVFGEAVDPFVLLGGAIIVASVSFIAWRESVLKRRRVTSNLNGA